MLIEEVDLIITTKNRIDELLFTIDSVINTIGLSQNQISIVDDASSDNTYDKVKILYPQIDIYRNDVSKGLIANRNYLMQNTNRPYILSLDDDSHIRSREDLEEALNILNENKDYGCFCFKPYEQLNPPPEKQQLQDNMKIVRTYIGCGHIIKRAVLEAVGYYLEPLEFYCEEFDFSIRAFKKGYLTVMKENLVVHHRIDWNERNKQLESDLKAGVYGAIWRSKLGFSNTLYLDYVHFAFPYNYYLIFKHITFRFYKYLVLKKDIKGFCGGLSRFFYLKRVIDRTQKKLTFSESKEYLKLGDF